MYEVVKVANGFMIRPGQNYARDTSIAMDQVFVFNTWEAAAEWLGMQLGAK